jgi:hypothetical protein
MKTQVFIVAKGDQFHENALAVCSSLENALAVCSSLEKAAGERFKLDKEELVTIYIATLDGAPREWLGELWLLHFEDGKWQWEEVDQNGPGWQGDEI